MNTQKIKKLAINFEKIAQDYARTDSEAMNLLNSLQDLINKAKAENVLEPEAHVPGNYWFTEGNLAQYTELETAYSKFSLALTINNDDLDELQRWAENRKKELFDKES